MRAFILQEKPDHAIQAQSQREEWGTQLVSYPSDVTAAFSNQCYHWSVLLLAVVKTPLYQGTCLDTTMLKQTHGHTLLF